MLEKRIMGLDYGSKTIGVAVSDLLGLTAQGIETININEQIKDFKIKRIKELVNEHNVGKIIVGYPKIWTIVLVSEVKLLYILLKFLRKKLSQLKSSYKMKDLQLWGQSEYFLKLMSLEKKEKM